MESKRTADLHIHSNYSDSDLSLEDIFEQAEERGISCVSITDHDTVDGVMEAKRLGGEHGIELIEGIEISSEHRKREVHVLGYFVDPESEHLTRALRGIKDMRRGRLLEMAEKVNSMGGMLDIDEFAAKINKGIATRLHLARYMLEKKQVNSIWEAFKKYLSFGQPAYVSRIKFSVEQAIEVIHKAKGLAVLAHPDVLPGKEWIKRFAGFGLDGLEVRYPRFSPELEKSYVDLAGSLGLIKTGGSDAHGSYKDFTGLGAVTVPYSWVEEMRYARRPLLCE